MTITLRPDQEETIAKAIESGAYQNADQVIERALEVLRSEDEWLHDSKDEIDRKIDRALKQFEEGNFYTADESRAEMERRKTAWLAARKR
jgi:Arc/MetJ-type ribon-helix-helix transcriptional regulator